VPAQSEEVVLDQCIELLFAGRDWEAALPQDGRFARELREMMAVAAQLARIARLAPHLQEAQRRRIWNRIESRIPERRSVVKRIALYRLPYLPALWIRPEAV
jgi:hypothetical protein